MTNKGTALTRVVLFANPEKPEALRLAGETEARLRTEGIDVVIATRLGEDLSAHRPDLAAVFGGDGTVLACVAGLGAEPPPILAFNLGRLGYLANNPPQRVIELIHEALAGTLQASRRITIEAVLESPRREWRSVALNEFVLSARIRGRQLPLSVWVDGGALMDIRGDGIIVATPTGSTAYALSAGGPVASPELAAIVLTPLCPHQLANRSLVLDSEETVRLRHFCDWTVDLIGDGRHCLELAADETLEIRVSGTVVRLLAQHQGRYKLLREKLGWGWRADAGK